MPKVTCAVVGCSHSTYQLNKWKNEYCSLHQSHNGRGKCSCPPPFTLVPFPTETQKEKRDIWINNINRKETVDRTVKEKKGNDYISVKHKKGDKWFPSSYDRVCSDHFIDGHPTDKNLYPVLRMGHQDKDFNKKRRKSPTFRSPIISKKLKHTSTPKSNSNSNNNTFNEFDSESQDRNNEYENWDHSYSFMEDNECTECFEKQMKINKLVERIVELEGILQEEINLRKKRVESKKNEKSIVKSEDMLLHCLRNDSQVRYYTGLTSVGLFNLLYEYTYDKVKSMPYWRGKKNTVVNRVRRFLTSPKKSGGKRLLSVKAELLLVLVKIKLGLLNHDLADRFGISDASVSSIFNTYVKVLAGLLKFLIYWPDKISVRANLPKVFERLYPRVRVTIDCSEFFLDTPRDLQLQAQIYSDYKHHATAKALVGISPRGCISYLSKCWGGRTSDRHITLHDGILDYVDRNDQWMADRGFLVRAELLERGAELIVPPGAKGHDQMIPDDVRKTKHIANLRIHVERAIQRMKCFRFLKNQIPLTHLVVVSALCNLQGPLVK